VVALAEQGKDHHVGQFDQLEDEQCMFTPLGFDGSPNRVDAKVWAYTELMLDQQGPDYETHEPSGFGRRM